MTDQETKVSGTGAVSNSGSQGSASEKTPENGDTKNHNRRIWLIRIGVVVLLAIGALVLWMVLRGPGVSDKVVQLSGRIEGDDSAIASKTSGRILEVRLREGDSVHQGDVIATLDDEQIRARENQAQASVAQALARVTAAQAQIGVLNHQLVQYQLQATQSKGDAAGRVKQAEADLAAAKSDYAQQNANLQIAEFDRQAYTRLAKSGAVSERQGKEAESKADAQAAAVAAAKQRVEAAQGALVLANTSLANPAIRDAGTAGVQSQLVQQESEVRSAQAQLTEARAQLVEAQANRQDLVIRAPFDGSIVTRTAEPGEVIAAGTAVVTMIDLTKVYLRGFVPEGQIGKIKLGQSARIYLDSATNSSVEASVARIDPQMTFTPENTYFKDDRVKQVVGLKLQLKAGFGYAKPGMPADGEILVQGDQWPAHSKQQ